jgi:dCTP deaminase
MTAANDQRETVIPLREASRIHHHQPAGPIPDWRIRALAADADMISPFEPGKVRKIHRAPVVSYGTSSYGYDLRLAPHDFRVFRHVPGLIVDPKAFDDRCLAPAELQQDAKHGDYFILPAHTYALGVVIERLKLPPNVTAIFIGKSTYARLGVIVNTTPGEAGWEGFLTVEISNSSGADCRIYANEGICQALFFKGVPCDRPYGDGKYQGQASGVTVAKV